IGRLPYVRGRSQLSTGVTPSLSRTGTRAPAHQRVGGSHRIGQYARPGVPRCAMPSIRSYSAICFRNVEHPRYPASSAGARCAMLGGGGIGEHEASAVTGGGGIEEQAAAVFVGGGTAEQDASAVAGGGGIEEHEASAVFGGGGIGEQDASAVTGAGGMAED